MAFVTLEDWTGQIECLVFPRVFERYQAILQPDTAVAISGKLSVREEESPKLLAERIVSLAEWHSSSDEPDRVPSAAPKMTDAGYAAQAPRKVYLRLSRSQMDAVCAALALHTGDVPVYLHLPEGKQTLLAGRSLWCDGSEACLDRLRSMLGSSNVVMKEGTT